MDNTDAEFEDVIDPTHIPTPHGDVEYADFGRGPAVMALHGTPGGYEQAVEMGRFLARAGFRIIAPSRPGYAGTALNETTRSFAGQAALLAGLMDSLGIHDAGIFGWSGGGPVAYEFARLYPERTAGLVTFACVSQPYGWDASKSEKFLMNTVPGNWLMRFLSDHVPDQVVSGALASQGDLSKEDVKARTTAIMADPQREAFVVRMSRALSTRGDRKAGTDNDLAGFEHLLLNLAAITVPTLVVQGTSDTDLPPPHSYHAADTIPGAQLVEIPGGTHLALFVDPGFDDAQAAVVDFFRKNSSTSRLN